MSDFEADDAALMRDQSTLPPATSPEGEDSAWDVAVSTDSPAHFRPDIEGLRAVAILAVLAYHARIPGTGGGFIGVDVFFVISGFLITGLLLREVTSTGHLDLPRFYARRARRLLPAALVVIAVTVALSAVILSPLRFPGVALDGAASSLYVSNYRYALIATDYFAADTEPSPLLHFWSLAVEEQFYLVWPVLILAAVRLLSPRRLWMVVGLVAAGSFALSVVLTDVNQPWAFYSLGTRAWQLALGASGGAGRPGPARAVAGVAGCGPGLDRPGPDRRGHRAHRWIDAISRIHRPGSSRGRGPGHHRRRSPGRVAGSSALGPVRRGGSGGSPTRSISGTGRS